MKKHSKLANLTTLSCGNHLLLLDLEHSNYSQIMCAKQKKKCVPITDTQIKEKL